ncbi:MAG: tRNA (adenosine(37)-N6)-dimethylallyltransferase MiaA [Christensenellales bacterium]|jgi:tRNA dimethylallyltransferase
MTKRKPTILIVGGPTASGKTSAAVEAALLLNGEIVGADSMQIYKRLSIGTAKPDTAEMKGVPHHMIDIVEPSVSYDVARYREQAALCIDGILSRGRLPIICGGTGLYIASLIYGMDLGGAPPDEDLRASLLDVLKKDGKEKLHLMLKQADAKAAERIHENDTRRVMRAIEAAGQGGNIKKGFRSKPGRYNYVFTALNMDRMLLYDRINARVDKMIERGLIGEVEGLLREGIAAESTALGFIGYKEITAHLLSGVPLIESIEAMKRNTRRYAKRQLTWLNRENCVWIDAGGVNAKAMAAKIAQIFRNNIIEGDSNGC